VAFCYSSAFSCRPWQPARLLLLFRFRTKLRPGGWAQIKVWASAPTLIASGGLSIDFDPSIFGPVAQLAVFSATGDQIGYANVNREHLDVHFSSSSAGIGQLPQLPLFTVSVPVLANAKPGTTSSIMANPSPVSYSYPNVAPGSIRREINTRLRSIPDS